MSIGVLGFIPERLTHARIGRGLTMTNLEDLTGISRQSISAYENGRSTPTPENIERLARELRFPVGYFRKPLQAHFDGVQPLFRSLKSVGQRDRDQVIAQLLWEAELTDYALSLVDLPQVNFPLGLVEGMPGDPRRIDSDRIVRAADLLREHWGLGRAPVPHLIRLLESNGIVVGMFHFDLPGVDGLSMWSKEHTRPYIVLNRDRGAAARLRMSLAHELGHVVLHRNYSSKGSGADELSKTLDDQAFAFAQAFLLPEDSFLRDVYSTSLDSFVGLKQKWKVAISAMLYRLRKLGMFSDAKYRSLMMQIAKRRWRTSEPFDDEWAPEEPILLKQALQVIVDHGLQDAERLEQDTQIETQIIQRLANLPATFFAPKTPDNLITFRAPR